MLHYSHRKAQGLLPPSLTFVPLKASKANPHLQQSTRPLLFHQVKLQTALFPSLQRNPKNSSRFLPILDAFFYSDKAADTYHEFSLPIGIPIGIPIRAPSSWTESLRHSWHCSQDDFHHSFSTLHCIRHCRGGCSVPHLYHLHYSTFLPKIQPSYYSAVETPNRSEGFSPPQLFSQANQTPARLHWTLLLNLQAVEVVSIQKPGAVKEEPRVTCVKIW